MSRDRIPRWLTTDYRLPRSALSLYEDSELSFAVIEAAWDTIDLTADPDVIDRELADLTNGQRALLAIHACAWEVDNGGLHQFFYNPAGTLAAQTLDGFERIGAPELADVLRRAMNRFPRQMPARDWEKRQSQMERQPNKWHAGFEALDDEFFRLEEGPPSLDDRLLHYVRSHLDEFARRD